MKFFPLVHALFRHFSVFFYADYGILYEEFFVRAHKSCCIMIYVHVYVYYVLMGLSLRTTFSNNWINSIELRNIPLEIAQHL